MVSYNVRIAPVVISTIGRNFNKYPVVKEKDFSLPLEMTDFFARLSALIH